MKIAILMSTYNGQKYVDEQLKSLSNQTLKDDMTVYIRDDGSVDDTVKIVESWMTKLNIVLYKGDNIGPANSFWNLFMNSEIQGDYYAFCDQDDIWDENKIQKGVEALENFNSDAALWCSNCRLIDADSIVIDEKMYKQQLTFSIISQLVSGTIQGCAMMFNNSLRKYVYGKKITKFPMHDYVMITYAIAAGRVIYDSTPSFSYRIHSNNVVANEGKSKIKHITDSVNKWFSKEHIYENSSFAKRILEDNIDYLDQETVDYINNLVNCKKSFAHRLKIVKNPLSTTVSKKAERSYKIRVMLGII